MTTPLYQASVASFLQILPALAGLVDKARAHCAAHGLPDEALTDARLAPDMWPFAKQLMAACQHSAGAVAGVRVGECGPDLTPPPLSFDALAAELAKAVAALKLAEPGELEAIAGDDTCFRYGETRMDYTVEDYLLSFALPNFYFHASMAYAVLRAKGVEIGKRDFLGAPRRRG